jgi:hypothetical protein
MLSDVETNECCIVKGDLLWRIVKVFGIEFVWCLCVEVVLVGTC